MARFWLLFFLLLCWTPGALAAQGASGGGASASAQAAQAQKKAVPKAKEHKTKAQARPGKEALAPKASAATPGKAGAAKPGKTGAAAASATPDVPAPKAAAAKKTVITDVQVYSGRDYSRIVLVLSGEARRRWQLLPPDPKDEGIRRLYVDLEDAGIRPGVPSRFDVKGDVARKVRLSYFKPGQPRLVVEVENLASHNVFVLENPYRVVVDVQGEASSRPPAGKGAKAAPDVQASRARPADKPRSKGAKAARGSVSPKEVEVAPLPGQRVRAKLFGEGKPGAPGVRFDTPGKKKMARQLVEQLGLTVRTVMVDAGHGGRDPGARGPGGILEKNVNLRVAMLLGRELKRRGFEVLYTRTTDRYVPLEARTAMANARKADLFVSVHCNAHTDAGASGMETYSLNLASTADEVRVAARENSVDARRISDMQNILNALMNASKLAESREFAKTAHQATLSQARKSLNLRDRGVHEAPFYVLLGARMPAILVEVGYITNPEEAAKLRDDKYLESLARGIAQGVESYKARIERYAQKD